MVSGWAIKACLSSWPFSLGWGWGDGEETQQEVVSMSRVGVLSSLAAPCPDHVSEKIQGRHLLA